MHAQRITELAKSLEVPLPTSLLSLSQKRSHLRHFPMRPLILKMILASPSAAPHPPTPSDQAVACASILAHSDLLQWDFAISQKGQLVSRHAKTQLQNPMMPSKIADVVAPEIGSPSEVLPPPEAGESPLCKKAKQTTVKVWPKRDTHDSLIYRPPDKSDLGDDAPSTVCADIATLPFYIDTFIASQEDGLFA